MLTGHGWPRCLLEQAETLELGADYGITSCDKAGLGGPRAGLMVGRPDLVERAVAHASGSVWRPAARWS